MYKQRPLVSIIVPIYNVEKYLNDTILSLRNQTYRNIEILLVDDCSTDKSKEIAQEHAKEDKRIQIFYHQKNKGPGGARNTGIVHAKGKYLMFLDSDDRYVRDAVYQLVSKIEKTDSDMVIGRMVWYINKKISMEGFIDEYINAIERYCGDNLRDLSAEKWSTGVVTARIYNMDYIKEHNLYFPENVYYEDTIFAYPAWVYAKKIDYISDIVYLRTKREDKGNLSITQQYSMKTYLDRDYLDMAIYKFLEGEIKKGIVTKEDLKIALKSVFSSTIDLVKHRRNELDEWVNEWYQGYQERHRKLEQQVELL